MGAVDRLARDAPSDPVSDATLWADLKLGDEAAFASLFHRYARTLCDFAFSHVDDADVAEDIVHALFVALWHSRIELVTPRNVRAYLLTSTRNRSLSFRRSELARSRAMEKLATMEPLMAAPSGPVTAVDERADLLRAAIRQLPTRCREVVMLVRFNHLTYAETATVLGIAPKTVEIHLSRAIKILREKLRGAG